MRRAANIDANHAEIVAKLRQCGVTVKSLAAVGGGTPDLLCGFRGKNCLLEVKSKGGKLNQEQIEWHATWGGQVTTVYTFQEAMDAILAACR